MSLLCQQAALEEPDLAQQVAPGLAGVSHLYEGAPPGPGNPPESHDNESDTFNHPSWASSCVILLLLVDEMHPNPPPS